MNTSILAKDLKYSQKQFSKLDNKHKMMKKYNKENKFSPQPKALAASEHIEEQVSQLNSSLVEKEAEIFNLQNEKNLLEEKIEDIEQGEKSTKSDGKTYSPEMRMMVYDAIVG